MRCVDLGCGHGIVARSFSRPFDEVIGTDPSGGMIEQAKSLTSDDYKNVTFRESAAESLPFLANGSVDMVVAGQAAHWFDYPKLFPEMARIVRKSGTFAVWGYKDHVFVHHPKATNILMKYAYGEDDQSLGPYWSQPGRSIVQNKLRDIEPSSEWEDVRRIEYEPGTNGSNSGEGTMYMNGIMRLGECMEYIRTWSAFHAWQAKFPQKKKRNEGGEGDVVDLMFDEMRTVEAEWQQARWEDKEVEIEWGSGILLARRK